MGIPVGLFTGKADEKEEVKRRFNQNDATHDEMAANDGIQWVVGTLNKMCSGLNMVRGSIVFNIETDYTNSKELQAMARVSRGGQRIKTKGYRFHMESLTEKFVLMTSQYRASMLKESLDRLQNNTPSYLDGENLMAAFANPEKFNFEAMAARHKEADEEPDDETEPRQASGMSINQLLNEMLDEDFAE